MAKKYKILIILGVLIIITFTAGIAYSFFTSSTTMTSNNQSIAKFVFNAEVTDNIELPLVDLTPEEKQIYSFEIKNTLNNTKSDVSVNYQITIKTYHFIPTLIKLYKGTDLIMTCDETYSRNARNELICNSEIMRLDYNDETTHNYKVEIGYEEGFNELSYKDLIDYIDLEINSWQIIE